MFTHLNTYTTSDVQQFIKIKEFLNQTLSKAVNNSINVTFQETSEYAVPYYANTTCEVVTQTIKDVANCTNCTAWTPKLAKKLPEITLYIGTTTDRSLSFNLTDLLFDEGT
jgi:hypothetical protein